MVQLPIVAIVLIVVWYAYKGYKEMQSEFLSEVRYLRASFEEQLTSVNNRFIDEHRICVQRHEVVVESIMNRHEQLYKQTYEDYQRLITITNENILSSAKALTALSDTIERASVVTSDIHSLATRWDKMQSGAMGNKDKEQL